MTVCACRESYHKTRKAVSVVASKPVLVVGSRTLISPGCPDLALTSQGRVRKPISSLIREKSNCPFSALTIKSFWLLCHNSTKASVTVFKHIQSSCINFRAIAHSAVREGKTEIGNSIAFPLSKEMNQERNGCFSSDF